MSKKAQGLSMTVIIVAAIALLVLVILAVIFIGRMGTTTKTIDDCESKGGQCVQIGACEGQYSRSTNDPCFDSTGDVDKTRECCLTVY